MSKTIRDWLKELPEPEQTQAFENVIFENKYPDKTLDLKVDSMPDAICNAFTWCDTPEDHDYWESIANRYL